MKKTARLLSGSGYTLPLLVFTLSALFLLAAISGSVTETRRGYAMGERQEARPPDPELHMVYANLEAAAITNENTEIVYEYYYTKDGITEKVSESAPLFLIGKDEDYFRRSFMDWELLSFSPGEVVMRKTVYDFSVQNYVIGIFEGYVAVFYANEITSSGIREVTDTPLISLPPAEQERLRKGIIVSGEENLVRAMQDFGS